MLSLLPICSVGFLEIKKVDILWNDRPKVSKAIRGSSGELYLRVSMSGETSRARLWSMLINDSLQIMDMIDWSRSHPDNINDFCFSYGIDSGWKYFLNVSSLCVPSHQLSHSPALLLSLSLFLFLFLLWIQDL